MTMMVRKFMTWWEKLPLFVGFCFIPIVIALYLAAIVINKFAKGEKR